MGIFDDVAEDVETRVFFTEELPRVFEKKAGEVSPEGMDGTVFKVVFNIAGNPYGLTITDARSLEVTEGGLDAPDIEVILSEENWRTAISGALGNALDMFTDFGKMADRNRYDTVKNVKGELTLVLTRSEGDFEVKAKFGGADSPATTITVDFPIWQEIMAGTEQAAMAFMGGKLKLTGDMPLAMSLNGLM